MAGEATAARLAATKKSIRLRILKRALLISCIIFSGDATKKSIRLRILKHWLRVQPVGKEIQATKKSIRLRILKLDAKVAIFIIC